MAAILFVVFLAAGPGQVGGSRALARYGAVDGETHLALVWCEAHAKLLTKASENMAYYCKEVSE
jgi:hypothetical protein